MKKFMVYFLKGLAVFGGLVLLAILWRSKKASDSSNVKFSDAVSTEVKSVTTLGILLMTACCFVAMYALSNGYGEVAMLAWVWASFPASATNTVNFTYIPQFIGFTATSTPTSILINVQGDGIVLNLDSTGVTAMSNIRLVGVVSNTYVFQLANGLINGKNGSITLANAQASTLDVQGWSMDPGNLYFTYQTQQALANSGFNLSDFAYASFPSAAASDVFTLEYNNRVTQVSQRADLNFALQYKQNQVTSRYNIDNVSPSMVKRVTFTPAATQNIYVMKYQAASGVVNSAVNNG